MNRELVEAKRELSVLRREKAEHDELLRLMNEAEKAIKALEQYKTKTSHKRCNLLSHFDGLNLLRCGEGAYGYRLQYQTQWAEERVLSLSITDPQPGISQ